MGGNPLSQDMIAQRLAVTDASAAQSRLGGGAHGLRDWSARFAQLHVNNAPAGAFKFGRLAQNIHRQKGRDIGSAGWTRRISHNSSSS
jgi:hypothetical protein